MISFLFKFCLVLSFAKSAGAAELSGLPIIVDSWGDQAITRVERDGVFWFESCRQPRWFALYANPPGELPPTGWTCDEVSAMRLPSRDARAEEELQRRFTRAIMTKTAEDRQFMGVLAAGGGAYLASGTLPQVERFKRLARWPTALRTRGRRHLLARQGAVLAVGAVLTGLAVYAAVDSQTAFSAYDPYGALDLLASPERPAVVTPLAYDHLLGFIKDAADEAARTLGSTQ